MPLDKPSWTCADRTADISDNWREETGDNETTVTAYFTDDTVECMPADPDAWSFYAIAPKLVGIALEDGNGPLFYDREYAVRALGIECVHHIEECMMNTANGW